MFDYGKWIDSEHARVRDTLDELGRRCGYSSTVALYALPSQGATPGQIIVSESGMAPPAQVVRFPAQGR